MWIFYLFAIALAIGIVWVLHERFISRQMTALSKELREVKKHSSEQAQHHEQEKLALNREMRRKENILNEREEQIQTIISEKTQAFPWLSGAIADLHNLREKKTAAYLEAKSHPARSAAEEVRRVGKEKRNLVEQLNIARYRIKYYESLFPFITDYIDTDIDDELIQVIDGPTGNENGEDPAQRFMTRGEYEKMPSAERNQLALDRYLRSRRPWQIGRDYERFVGNYYERQGYQVLYFGIEEGFEDLGRDLICSKPGHVLVVQCKCWSSRKVIHEKHVNQLFGTAVKYYIDRVDQDISEFGTTLFPELLKEGKVHPVFWTSTMLTETARKFAVALGIEVRENEPLQDYPLIKCHTNKSTGERIYHLPFDQMYDRTILESRFGEYYASSVLEAEESGFRRAWRWKGA
ncbi:MAG: restriction endonuclease [Flavobacteriales bacterium]